MTESKKIIRFELEQPLYQTLKENLIEKPEPEKVESQPIIEDSNQIDKERLIKKWKESAGYYNLNPEKFRFSLKNL